MFDFGLVKKQFPDVVVHEQFIGIGGNLNVFSSKLSNAKINLLGGCQGVCTFDKENVDRRAEECLPFMERYLGNYKRWIEFILDEEAIEKKVNQELLSKGETDRNRKADMRDRAIRYHTMDCLHIRPLHISKKHFFPISSDPPFLFVGTSDLIDGRRKFTLRISEEEAVSWCKEQGIGRTGVKAVRGYFKGRPEVHAAFELSKSV